jgi:hypothetical protein
MFQSQAGQDRFVLQSLNYKYNGFYLEIGAYNSKDISNTYILEKQYGFRTKVLKSFPDQNSEKDIPGLEALAEADLAVFFLRWRLLPADQVAHIEAYLK